MSNKNTDLPKIWVLDPLNQIGIRGKATINLCTATAIYELYIHTLTYYW